MANPVQTKIPDCQLPIEKRLETDLYNAEDCNAAIHGQRLPAGLGSEVTRLCIIHGIRHHYGFAQELRGATPQFTRALNARDIMSGVIPEMDVENKPDEVPYCIWHPDVVSEDALRTLVQRYPSLVYHAARACAIAGFIDLYRDLDVLPEVHVAEEACHASLSKVNKGSEAIYQDIMAHGVKYTIMNDYTRTVDIANPYVGCLNGDTAVYSSLAARQVHNEPGDMDDFDQFPWMPSHSTSHYFNITEDWGIDDHECNAPKPPVDFVPFLCAPLPRDLPPIDKDMLILSAAYHGDIDRYDRLRRHKMIIEEELACVIRGIFHNVLWAKWWDTQLPDVPGDKWENATDYCIRCAINARRIMSDDITCVTTSTPHELIPTNIWWPECATAETYARLARKRPDMLDQCLQACVVAGYQDMWNELLSSPIQKAITPLTRPSDDEMQDQKLKRLSEVASCGIYTEARASPNPQFLRDLSSVPGLLERLDELTRTSESWEVHIPGRSLYSPKSHHHKILCRERPVQICIADGAYEGMHVEFVDLGFALFAKDLIRPDSKAWSKASLKGERFVHNEELYKALEAGT